VSDVALQLTAAWPAGASVEDARLSLGGILAADLAAQYGTPAYIVDEPELRARARAYVEAFARHPGKVNVCFASKAFPCTAVFRALHEEGMGADVASAGELFLALKAGVDPSEIVVHGNGKSRSDLAAAVRAGVAFVVVDNPDEIQRLADAAASEGVMQDVLVRVTPDVRGATHDKISTGQADSKFGFAPAEAIAARERIDAAGSLRFRGWHLHIGSQLFELDAFDRAIRTVAASGPCEVLDVGGGLGVAYGADQQPPTVEEYADVVLRAVHETVGEQIHLIVEPGRSVSARAGVTLYTVTSVKRNVSTWVAVDGGMSDNLRPMLYQAQYDAALVDRIEPSSPDHETVRLAGLHCESGDVLIDAVALPTPQAGDVVAVPTTGAYTFSMANTYNGTPRSPVVFVGGGESRVVVRRETLEELGARDVE
jgi:diaminopimelate decarboxylase